MAAFNGWLVNEAVTAATAAATSAFSAEPAADPASASAASPAPPSMARRISAGEDTGAVGTPSKWSLAGLLSRSTSLGREQQPVQPSSAGKRAAAEGLQSESSISSMDEDYSPPYEQRHGTGLGRSSSSSTDDESLGDVDSIATDEAAEAETTAAAVARGLTRRARKAAGAAAAASGFQAASGSSYVFVQHPDVARKVKALRAVLLWRNGATSWKVLAAGLYLVMLIGYIPRGEGQC